MTGPTTPQHEAQPQAAGSARPASPPRLSTRTFTLAALGLALVVACVISLWASSHPDGLEYVASALGFEVAAEDSLVAGSPLADYAVAAIRQPWVSVALAGAIGCAATFGLALLVSRLAGRRVS